MPGAGKRKADGPGGRHLSPLQGNGAPGLDVCQPV